MSTPYGRSTVSRQEDKAASGRILRPAAMLAEIFVGADQHSGPVASSHSAAWPPMRLKMEFRGAFP